MKRTIRSIISTVLFLVFLGTITSCASTKSKNNSSAKAEEKPAVQEPAKPAEPEDPGVVLLFDESRALKDTGKKDFTCTSATEVVKNMTIGWNLGNTLDAIGSATIMSETSWGQPKTTKEMIDGLAKSGIKTIRIPVSWSKHMDKHTYTVYEDWMARVKTIVDWAIEADMYVIINSHHDNFDNPRKMPACSGYYPNSTNKIESERYLLNLWTQIALAFNDGYDEHLIFETMNEPRPCGTNHEWWFDANAADCKDSAACLNEYNQLVVDTVRASGGNNKKRFIACPALAASPDSALAAAFKMPEDDEPDKLIVSIHMYTPYSFAMQSPGETKFTVSHQANLKQYFTRLNTRFISKGYPVYIGEFGATNKNNLEDRVAWFSFFVSESRQYGMTCMLWDNGVWEVKNNDYNEHYGFYNRREQTWYFPEILAAMTSAANTVIE